ncbi:MULTISPECIES: enoyl-CoA hydratase/isomerase family protein [unclassified Beijerinckia]|uniref:enoyl-CoA hydratase/isomerase family protein n=1 Tax=unclassified Beijerinckia TaxID=2638183 RepID=UPI000897F4EA|nr:MULTISPECIES: enoyl-CoA hydratase/isomerase family protein [unclassified Beijerinckia]MDH7799007.1 enoyl-CoA hydratase/carnithine racemase [Beijerinckia sp. GAS462]SED84554.1 enoyl-CoA hydratase [Beijerinckia sp. 28-YEA-48]
MSSKSEQSVVLDERGLPVGFLGRVTDFLTIATEQTSDGIFIIKLNRPNRLNAFDEQMIREMRSVIWKANFDDTIRVIVITGEGRAFCSGRDINGLDYENNLETPGYRAYVRANHELFDDIEAIEKPVIAAVNGICAGGGVEMAIACDFRMASSNATFLLPENQLGVIPASGACSRMIQMIGIGRLKEMVMAALPVSAEEAYRIGLINRLFSEEELLPQTMAFARELLKRAPQAMGMGKHIINMCQNVDTETGRLLERLGQSVLIRTHDNKEGMTSFREKRRPHFTGK